MDVVDLLAEVDSAFAVTGAQTPGWPAPHPHRMPLESEYSRCLDPGKYRILGARLEAWERVLVARGVAVVALDEDGSWWRPTRRGAVPLRVVRSAIDRENGLAVSLEVGDPPHRLEVVPDCGCDACDSGSAGELEVLDGAVLVVLSGGVLRVAHGRAVVTRTPGGWAAGNAPPDVDPAAWLAGDHPDGADVVRGEPWF